ncbi:MAG: hypothetical protein AAGC97_18355 [Planctomycetota bacterium]
MSQVPDSRLFGLIRCRNESRILRVFGPNRWRRRTRHRDNTFCQANPILLAAITVIVLDGFHAARLCGQSSLPQTNLSPIGPPTTSPVPSGAGAYGVPAAGTFVPPPTNFDPYGPRSSMTPLGVPTVAGAPAVGNPSYPNGGLLNGLFSGQLFGGSASSAGYTGLPAGSAPYAAAPIYNYGAPPAATGFPTAPTTGIGGAPFPSSAYPSGAPSTLFPGGLSAPSFAAPSFNYGLPNGPLFPNGLAEGLSAYRFLHGPRLRHTFISGGDDVDDVGLNQTDVSIGFAFNNFLFSTRPLYVVPSFSLYLFDGPRSDVASGQFQDLPANAYGGFIDFGWQSDPNRIVGGELGVRVGAFTDFDTFNDDSIRIQGKGLLSFRLTPTTTLKGGIYYLDRHSISMLPAGGLLCQPNPFTRFDIFFPEPKFARYWRTIGTQDVWWYVAGEFGGDSWTITRANRSDGNSAREERVDLNQIDVMFGWEWGRSDLIRAGQRTAFFEFGYVFDRELDYDQSPDDLSLDDAFLFRAGLGY